MKEFLAMGGYGFYVWTSYGLAVVILLWNLLCPFWQRRRFLEERLQQRKPAGPS